MSTFNGIGTKFYGKTDVEQDGSYTTTKWFVLIYLPIYPIGSFRVIKEENSTNLVVYNSKKYQVIQVDLHKKQIIKTYAWIYGMAALIILLIRILQSKA
jgi:hypothetical protein